MQAGTNRPSIGRLVLLGSILLAGASDALGAESLYCRLDSRPWLGCEIPATVRDTTCTCATDRDNPDTRGHIRAIGDEEVVEVSSESTKLALGIEEFTGTVHIFVPRSLIRHPEEAATADEKRLAEVLDLLNFRNLAPPPPVAAVPAPSAPGGAPLGPTSHDRLTPTRLFLAAPDIPPPDVGGYGIIALRSKPTPSSRARLEMLCRSFLASLPPNESVPSSVPLSQRVVMIWPLDLPNDTPDKTDCRGILDGYSLYSGQSAIADAVSQGANLSGRGPFLIAWKPSSDRYASDRVVLVVDMSAFETQESFDEGFLFWQRKVIEEPGRWSDGFRVAELRIAIKEFADKYGATIGDALGFGRGRQ